MLASFVIFFIGALSVLLFLIWKVPVLVKLPEEKEEKKDFISSAKEKLEEGVKKEVNERFQNLLQKFLSDLRRITIKVEKTVTRWLYLLRRKRKKREKEEKKENEE